MPHKRNPVTSEQISGLARVVRANAQAPSSDIALWHAREHLPLLRRASHPPRLHHPRRLSPRQDRKTSSRASSSIPRRHDCATSKPPAASSFGPVVYSTSPAPNEPRRRYRRQSHATARLAARPRLPRSRSPASPRSPAALTPSNSSAPSTYHRQLAKVDAIFSRVSVLSQYSPHLHRHHPERSTSRTMRRAQSRTPHLFGCCLFFAVILERVSKREGPRYRSHPLNLHSFFPQSSALAFAFFGGSRGSAP